jgi:UDP-N-acetylglucosamine--N-acetylmuramyl-(pentapeptide) pyrophosphoryl-undecaprenol N-acetylglucosamine transferase
MTTNKTRTPNLILLAAGGTGGHVFPAEALARELLARGWDVELVTDGRGQAFGGDLAGVPVHRISAASPGKGIWGKLKAGLIMGRGLMQANAMMRRMRPAGVVGFGGYPSVPAVLAAAGAQIPVAIHEQNAVLGRANGMLAAGAKLIATAFPSVAKLGKNGEGKQVRVGNPVRASVAARRDAPYIVPAAADPLNLPPLNVLVMGGSQGAAVFSDLIPAALALLPASLRARIRLSQQARPEDVSRAQEALAVLGLGEATVESFFRDVPERLEACRLAITRAGASTIAELTCIGRPAILVPYPFAADDHQTANARAVEAAGAAVCAPQDELTPQRLAQLLTKLLTDTDAAAAMAAASHAWGCADAAQKLADRVEDLIENHNNHADNAVRHQPREAAE